MLLRADVVKLYSFMATEIQPDKWECSIQLPLLLPITIATFAIKLADALVLHGILAFQAQVHAGTRIVHSVTESTGLSYQTSIASVTCFV